MNVSCALLLKDCTMKWHIFLEINLKKGTVRDFPGDPVVKTPCSQCRRPGLVPLSGN